MITQSELKQLFHYDPETGVFTWIRSGTGRKTNKLAGWIDRVGYVRIEVHGKAYCAHRLAWLYVYGCWPTKYIDHINRIKGDNRISNLRDVTKQQNLFNLDSRKGSTSSYLGVHLDRESNKYRASIRVNNKLYNLGRFNNEIDAHQAYLKAKAELHVI